MRKYFVDCKFAHRVNGTHVICRISYSLFLHPSLNLTSNDMLASFEQYTIPTVGMIESGSIQSKLLRWEEPTVVRQGLEFVHGYQKILQDKISKLSLQLPSRDQYHGNWNEHLGGISKGGLLSF